MKIITSLIIILLLFISNIAVNAGAGDHGHPEYIWKQYPYHPPGTNITFPDDEGSHDGEYQIEWWYVNFNLTGESGNEYGALIIFYQINSYPNVDGLRLFSISDITEEQTYTNGKFGTLSASTDHLNLRFEYSSDCSYYENVYAKDKPYEFGMHGGQGDTSTSSSQSINTPDFVDHEIFDEITEYDYFYTKSNDSGLIPFQYALIVGGNSQEGDHQPMKLALDMDCLKRPLIVDGDGVIEFGGDYFSFYYSLTKLAVSGTISVHGTTEEVTGYAWLDHQWGNFIEDNAIVVSYEWFAIKLDDNREIMVGDAWNRTTGEIIDHSILGGLNLVNSDGFLELLEDYTITPLSYYEWNSSSGLIYRKYAAEWQITETSKSINITVTPYYSNQMMCIWDNFPILQALLEKIAPGACFWEGICMVTGTINELPVNGNAYVELTHSYESESQPL